MSRLAIYSAGHFFVDFSCALLVLGRLCPGGDCPLLLLIYNFCAFALQMPLGLLADRLNRNSLLAAAGCLLAAAAWLVLPLAGALPAAFTAGFGNALYHIGGGIEALNSSQGKSGALGVFVSPGALGVFLGGLAAAQRPGVYVAALAALALTALVILRRQGPSENPPASLPGLTPRGMAAALALFLVVVLRSYIGSLFVFPWKTGVVWAGISVCAVAFGKAAGGFLGDNLGMRRAAAISLGLAIPLFLAADYPAAGLAAVFLFNMTMPLTLWAAARLFPAAKGFSFGLLTFALFLGFLPALFGAAALFPVKLARAAGAALSIPALLFGLSAAKGGEKGG